MPTENGTPNDDTLNGGSGDDILNGFAGDDILNGRLGNDTLNGGFGRDQASYRDASGPVTVTLGEGTAAGSATGADGTDTLFSIENVRGSDFADSITGNSESNFLRGGQGNDTLNGGLGLDFADYRNAAATVTVTLGNGAAAGTSSGADGIDQLFNFEGVRGGDFNDRLTGNAGVNFLIGGLGNDTLDGGLGFDFADYRSAEGAVTVNLATGTSSGTDGVDTLIRIEGVRGSSFNDTLIGNTLSNRLEGDAGRDTLDGGLGFDFARYQSSTVGVTASLASPGTNTGDAFGDVYISIEGLIGSDFDDRLTGNGFTNILNGGDGADRLDGGLGVDYASYNNLSADAGIVASLANPGANTGEAAGDVYVGIEGLIGTEGADRLFGNAGVNFLAGGGGADSLNGGGGIDFASYAFAERAVRANLATPSANTGEAAGDTYALIEGLIGSDFGDLLTGNAGANVLGGRFGRDLLNGGAGADAFLFDTALNARTNADTIQDFSHAQDTIRLSKAVFAAIAGPLNRPIAAEQFALTTQAVESDDRIIYNASTGQIFYDADGGARNNAVLFATVSNPTTAGVAFDDFVLVA